MLKLLLLSSALLISSITRADTYQASQLYHQQKYPQAKAEFELLLPLGNATAAFNLAVMAMNGQGMEQDIELAYSYFSLAAELGHPDALTGIQTLDSRLSDEQKQQAQEQAKLWHSQAVPSYASMQQQKTEQPAKDNNREIIQRVEPRYPINAARRGTQGFASVLLLIDEQGEVIYAQTQHSFPAGVFDDAAEHALRQWRYQPSPQKSIHTVTLSFNLDMAGQDKWRDKLLMSLQQDTWPGALAGIASYQYTNAILLNYLDPASDATADLNLLQQQLPPQQADFQPEKARAVTMPAFNGTALVQVDEQKKLIQLRVLDGEVPLAEGDRLEFIDKAGEYRIAPWDLNFNTEKSPFFAKDKMYLKAIPKRPKEWTDDYWLDQAARNGLLEAQHARAQFAQGWAKYLQQKNDPVALGWYAIELLTEQKNAEAKAVFKQAQTLGFEATAELEVLFQ